MSEIGSPAWVERLDRAGDGIAAEPEAEGFVLQQVVVDGDDERCWTLTVRDGAVRAAPGRADHPTVTLTTDLATATSVAAGELSAQGAFMAGRLQIGGDPTALVRAAQHLGELARWPGVPSTISEPTADGPS